MQSPRDLGLNERGTSYHEREIHSRRRIKINCKEREKEKERHQQKWLEMSKKQDCHQRLKDMLEMQTERQCISRRQRQGKCKFGETTPGKDRLEITSE